MRRRRRNGNKVKKETRSVRLVRKRAKKETEKGKGKS
jgi:hypothetical protein